MTSCNLTLTPFGKPPQNVPLFQRDYGRSVIDYIIDSEIYIFADLTYSATIVNPFLGDSLELEFYLNGVKVDTEVTADGYIVFNDESYGSRIFSDCYGFVQISIVMRSESDELSLNSDYLSIMVRKGRQNDSVRRMANYLYTNNEMLLYGEDVHPRDLSGIKESGYKSLESRILILSQIALCYEENYRYFKANSRFKTKTCESIDNFDKLQYITNNTIQYIVQHPEQLNIVTFKSGIKYNQQYFQPQKTLMSKNIYTFDIYENQVVVGFLKSIIETINQMISTVSKMISRFPNEPKETESHIASSFFIYSSTKKILSEYETNLNKLCDRYIVLYGAYQTVLNVSVVAISVPPKPTAILLSVLQYRQVYDAILSWFQLGIYDLRKEQFMLSFIKINTLYECYVLSKIYQFLLKRGFSHSESRRCIYPFSGKTFYQNTICHNTFTFMKDNKIITLYYQPVVYCDDRRSINGIGLYRNNSISFPKDSEFDYHGSYYAPDFILKIEEASNVNYVIADAKFSSLNTVKKYQVPLLAFKYLFSISPIEHTDKVLGLCIINGQSDSDVDTVTDVYDKSMTPGNIYPHVELLTLTENNQDNEKEHLAILKLVFDKYLSP